MKKLTHTDDSGKAIMVDISGKPVQLRVAIAEGSIKLEAGTIELIKANNIKKGDVLTVAEIAGIQAAKQTSSLIPLCHPLQITKVNVKASILSSGIKVFSTVSCIGSTGVEMEALTAVSVALLTIYDMCKAVDKNMIIESIRLTGKEKTDLK
jgi:cyclic pyranopterin monophosphate synthase